MPSGAERPDLLAGEALPPPPQQARSRLKREALLQAALALFGEYGYEAASVELIAQRAGVAVGAFYQHFSSKRQLVLVLMEQLLEEAAQLTALASASSGGSLRDSVAALVRQGLQTDWAYAGAFRAWRELTLHDSNLRAVHRQIEAWTAGQLELMLGLLAQAPGTRSNLDLPALAAVLSLLFWQLIEQPATDPAEAERLVASLTELILHGLFEDSALGA